MAVSTSLDPIQAVKDILDNSTDSDWSNNGSKPSPIERMEATEFSIKVERAGEAIYIWSPVDSDNQAQGAGVARTIERPVVQCDCWSLSGQTTANDLARDVRSVILQYSDDNQSQTKWHRFEPLQISDATHETRARRADHYIKTFQTQLMRESNI